MSSEPLIENAVILRRPRVASFVYINKVAAMFIKKTFKDSKRPKIPILNTIKGNKTDLMRDA